jgi:uncharacterized protein YndB with AHSA1/START domain
MFRSRTEFDIRCTPAALWRALAEAPGVQAWFAPDVRITPGDGGSVWVSWDPEMGGESRITAWEPERRFAYAIGGAPDAEPNITEFAIAPACEICRLTVTQTGLATEEHLNAVARRWGLFLHILKHGLEHPHEAAQNVTVFRYYDIPVAELWSALQASRPYQQVAGVGEVVFDRGAGFRGIEFPGRSRGRCPDRVDSCR